jgi:hypothetical protein
LLNGGEHDLSRPFAEGDICLDEGERGGDRYVNCEEIDHLP